MRDLRHKQFYWPDTNVLVTRFLSPDGVGQITDFMPVGVPAGCARPPLARSPGQRGPRDHGLSAGLSSRIQLCPRPASDRHLFGRGLFSYPKPQPRTGDACALEAGRWRVCPPSSSLQEGETAAFVLRQMPPGGGCNPLSVRTEPKGIFKQRSTIGAAGWRNVPYQGRWREMVHRSALVLKAPDLRADRRHRRRADL